MDELEQKDINIFNNHYRFTMDLGPIEAVVRTYDDREWNDGKQNILVFMTKASFIEWIKIAKEMQIHTGLNWNYLYLDKDLKF